MNMYKSAYLRIGLYLSLVSSVFSLAFLDPINWPKQVALVTVTPLVLLHSLKVGVIQNRFFAISISLYALFGLASFFLNNGPLVRELWGTFGRNNGLISFLSFTVLILCGYLMGSNSVELPRLLATIQIMTGLAGIYGLLQIAYLDPIKWSQDGQAFAFFGNINFASAIFALGAIASAAQLMMNHKNSVQVAGHLISMIFQFIMILLTESIQGLLMFSIASAILIFILLQTKFQKLSVFFLTSSMTLGIIVFISFLGIGPFGDSLYQYTLKLRYYYWLSGINIGFEHFWFGAGFDSFGDYYRNVRPTEVIDITGVDITVNNSHNAIIQIFATLGIFPAFLLLSLYLAATYKCVRVLLSKKPSIDKKVLAVLFIPLAINSLFSIDNISIAVWNHLFLGLALSLRGKFTGVNIESPVLSGNAKRTSPIRSPEIDKRRVIGIASSILCFIVAWSSSYPERAIVTAFQSKQTSSTQIDPRVASLRNIAFNSMTRDQDFRYIAEGLSTLGQNEVAIEVLYEGIRRFPREYQLYDYLAVFLERLNRKEEAVQIRKQQIDLDPSHPKIWLYYAFDLSDLGKKELALAAFEKVLILKKYLSQEDIEKLDDYRNRIYG